MRARPHELALMTLAGEFPGERRDDLADRGVALEFLRQLTEEDFGDDLEAWRDWFRRCPRDMLDLHYDEYYRKERIRARPEWLAWAERHWGDSTRRRCPECGGLCPEYRAHCRVCGHHLGRAPYPA